MDTIVSPAKPGRPRLNPDASLDTGPIGDMRWFCALTGWSKFKGARLCRLQLVPGAYNPQKGVRGSKWSFRKAITQAWFENLVTR
jgi:hypothetical protein